MYKCKKLLQNLVHTTTFNYQSNKTEISNKTKIYIFISLFINKRIETEYHLQNFF
jgi:hypothetical protein